MQRYDLRGIWLQLYPIPVEVPLGLRNTEVCGLVDTGSADNCDVQGHLDRGMIVNSTRTEGSI